MKSMPPLRPLQKNEIGRERYSKTYGPMATLAQLLAMVALSLLSVGMGMEFSISTIVIRVLNGKSKNDISMSFTEATWYGSMVYVTQPVGCVLSGILQGRFGKKSCMIFANAPSAVGWMLLGFCAHNSPAALYASNLLMGFSIGFSTGVVHPYVGEITEPRLRGTMASLLNTACFGGQALGHALGTLFEWRTVALLSAICPAACTCLILFVRAKCGTEQPGSTLIESPIWLATKGENKKAVKSLCWLRGWTKPEAIQLEFLELVHYSEVSGKPAGSNDDSVFSKFRLFKDPLVYKPFKIMAAYFFVAFVVGITPARPFLGRIMTEAGLSNHQNVYFMVLSLLQCVGSVILSLTIRRLGKRFLTLFTVTINSISLASFGLYVIAVKNRFVNPSPWIPLMLLGIIYLSGSCGVSCIVWMLLGEIFPNKCRGFVTGLCAGFANILLFTMTKLFLTVVTVLTMEYALILFGGIGSIGFVYFYIFLPETENKTLLEIEENFVPSSKSQP